MLGSDNPFLEGARQDLAALNPIAWSGMPRAQAAANLLALYKAGRINAFQYRMGIRTSLATMADYTSGTKLAYPNAAQAIAELSPWVSEAVADKAINNKQFRYLVANTSLTQSDYTRITGKKWPEEQDFLDSVGEALSDAADAMLAYNPIALAWRALKRSVTPSIQRKVVNFLVSDECKATKAMVLAYVLPSTTAIVALAASVVPVLGTATGAGTAAIVATAVVNDVFDRAMVEAKQELAYRARQVKERGAEAVRQIIGLTPSTAAGTSNGLAPMSLDQMKSQMAAKSLNAAQVNAAAGTANYGGFNTGTAVQSAPIGGVRPQTAASLIIPIGLVLAFLL
jgi:hypothetical protein